MTDFPAMVSVAVRMTDEVFAAIDKVTVLLPVPFVPEVTVIQLTLLAAVQEQVFADAVSVTFPVPAADPTARPVADNAYVHVEVVGGGDVVVPALG